jgi:hypothetical protein
MLHWQVESARNNQVVVVLKYSITERQRQLVRLEIDGIFVGIRATGNMHTVYGIPVSSNRYFL